MGQGLDTLMEASGVVHSFPLQLAASAGCCFAVQASRWFVDPIAYRWSRKLGAKTVDEQTKFSQQVVNFVFHGAIGAWLAKIVYSNNWLSIDNAKEVWASYPNLERNPTYVALYCIQFGYHLQRLLQMGVKKRKKDFVEMAIHHTVTVGLIGYSAYTGYVRIGMCVLMVHDLSDCLGCLCKILSSLNWKKSLIASFFPMQASWAYTRLYVLPCQIIPLCYLCPAGANDTGVLGCVGGLWVLVGLNAYWYSLFMKMLYTLATKGKAQDLQEDKPEEKSVQ